MRSFLLSLMIYSSCCAQTTINPSQIRPGTNGQSLQTVGGVTAWNYATSPIIINALSYSGSDIGAKVNAAWAANGGCGFVAIPSGTYSYSTEIIINSPCKSLLGSGSSETFLNYTGGGDALLFQMDPFLTQKAGSLQGMTIKVTSSASNVIHTGTVVGATFRDLVLDGAVGAGASAVLAENINACQTYSGATCTAHIPAWFEHNTFENVFFGNPSGGVGNTNALRLYVNAGRNSFARNDIKGGHFQVLSEQLLLNEDASGSALPYAYGGSWEIHGNYTSASGTSDLMVFNGYTQNLTADIEVEGTCTTKAIHVGSSGLFQVTGNLVLSCTNGSEYQGTYALTSNAGVTVDNTTDFCPFSYNNGCFYTTAWGVSQGIGNNQWVSGTATYTNYNATGTGHVFSYRSTPYRTNSGLEGQLIAATFTSGSPNFTFSTSFISTIAAAQALGKTVYCQSTTGPGASAVNLSALDIVAMTGTISANASASKTCNLVVPTPAVEYYALDGTGNMFTRGYLFTNSAGNAQNNVGTSGYTQGSILNWNLSGTIGEADLVSLIGGGTGGLSVFTASSFTSNAFVGLTRYADIWPLLGVRWGTGGAATHAAIPSSDNLPQITATAPTGTCSASPTWILSNDGKISYCKTGTWEVVTTAP